MRRRLGVLVERRRGRPHARLVGRAKLIESASAVCVARAMPAGATAEGRARAGLRVGELMIKLIKQPYR